MPKRLRESSDDDDQTPFSSLHKSNYQGYRNSNISFTLETGDYLRRIYTVLQDSILFDLQRLLSPLIKDDDRNYDDILSCFNLFLKTAANNVEFRSQLRDMFENCDVVSFVREINDFTRYLFYNSREDESINIKNLFYSSTSLIEAFYRKFKSFSPENLSHSLESLRKIEDSYELYSSLEAGEVLEPSPSTKVECSNSFTTIQFSQHVPSPKKYENHNLHRDRNWNGSYQTRSNIISMLKGGYSLQRFKENGISVQDFRDKQISAMDVKKSGFSFEEALEIGYSFKELHTAGYNAVHFRSARISPVELREGGLPLDQLKRCGFTASELKNAGFTAKELSECFPPAQMRNAFSLQELLGVGYHIGQLRAAQFTATELSEAGVTLSQMRMSGFTALNLKKVPSASLPKLKEAGFTAVNLKEAGFGLKELKEVGFTASQLRGAKFCIQDLMDVGFTPLQLRSAGFIPQELKLILTCEQMRDAGYPPSQLKSIGYSASDLISAGYELNQLLTAGFSAEEIRDSYD